MAGLSRWIVYVGLTEGSANTFDCCLQLTGQCDTAYSNLVEDTEIFPLACIALRRRKDVVYQLLAAFVLGSFPSDVALGTQTFWKDNCTSTVPALLASPLYHLSSDNAETFELWTGGPSVICARWIVLTSLVEAKGIKT